jgi:hypothetical protein
MMCTLLLSQIRTQEAIVLSVMKAILLLTLAVFDIFLGKKLESIEIYRYISNLQHLAY